MIKVDLEREELQVEVALARKSSYTNVRNEMGNVSGFDGAAISHFCYTG